MALREDTHDRASDLERSVSFDPLMERLGSNDGVFGVRSPLRACPLGAHVDHQGGVVTGLALDRSVFMVSQPLDQAVIRLESLDFPGLVDIGLHGKLIRSGDWGDYLRAVVSVLRRDFRLDRGFSGVIRGDLPGMGLSSSAAVLVTYLLALAEINDLDLDRRMVARIVQRAENEFIGVSSGLLDQSVILFAQEGCLTHIDCSDFSVSQTSLHAAAPDSRILVFFSGASRQLVGTDYNSRVEECRRAAGSLLQSAGMPVPAEPRLGDVPAEVFESLGQDLPGPLDLRAVHFFGEIVRVRKGVEAWRRGDLVTFGELINDSGESSIVNYQCGTPPLVLLWEALRDCPGVFGARFAGAGFGGSCLALVDAEAAEDIVERVGRTYRENFSEPARNARTVVCCAGGPAAVVPAEAF